MGVEIRRADSDADRLAVLRIANAAFDQGRPFLPRAGLRMAQRRRSLARWWLLLEDGEPAAGLHDYLLVFGAEGREIPGSGIGLVGTLPGKRGRGYASRLLEAALEGAEQEGRGGASLLFSAIDPAFYERFGYRTTTAEDSRCDDPAALAEGERAELLPVDPWRHAERLAGLYERVHGGALHLSRDLQRWQDGLVHNPEHLFLAEDDGGYARLEHGDEELEIVELIVPEARRVPILRAIAALAAGKPLRGWFSAPAALEGHFRPGDRAKTRPMVRGELPLEGARFWSSDYF